MNGQQIMGLVMLYFIGGAFSFICAVNRVPEYLRKSHRPLAGDEAIVLCTFWPLFWVWLAVVGFWRGIRGLFRS